MRSLRGFSLCINLHNKRSSKTGSSHNLGQHVDASDIRSHPKITAIDTIFHADDRSPAAYPALLPLGQFRGQNQHHLQIAAFDNVRIGVKKDAAAAQVAGISGSLNGSLLEFDRDRDPHRKAVSHAAFRLAVGHERGGDYHNAPGSTSYELRVTNSELQGSDRLDEPPARTCAELR